MMSFEGSNRYADYIPFEQCIWELILLEKVFCSWHSYTFFAFLSLLTVKYIAALKKVVERVAYCLVHCGLCNWLYMWDWIQASCPSFAKRSLACAHIALFFCAAQHSPCASCRLVGLVGRRKHPQLACGVLLAHANAHKKLAAAADRWWVSRHPPHLQFDPRLCQQKKKTAVPAHGLPRVLFVPQSNVLERKVSWTLRSSIQKGQA